MTEESQRLDKWLWHARFCKHRTLATALCAEGRVRVNSMVTAKPHQAVRAGDVLTLPVGPGAFAAGHTRPSGSNAGASTVAIVRILALAPRRGPATLARTLYELLSETDGSVMISDDARIMHGTLPQPSDIPDRSRVE